MAAQKTKINWVEGGIVIGLVATIDLIQTILLFLIVGFVTNWLITGIVLLGFGIWLLMKGKMTMFRGGVLAGAIFGSIVPFATTTVVSIMIARIIAAQTIAKVSPTLANAVK